MTIEEIFFQLGLKQGLETSRAQERRIFAAAGASEPASARFNDACFLNEGIARAVLSSNLVRIGTSAKICMSVISRDSPKSVTELGGAAGLVCFAAASNNPDCRFTIVDRARTALFLGRRWADRLGLRNVNFCFCDFDESPTIEQVGGKSDMVLLDYVLPLSDNELPEDELVGRMAPYFHAAAQAIAADGRLQLRFGQFSENGIGAMVLCSFRHGFEITKADVNPIAGHTFELRVTDKPANTEEEYWRDVMEHMRPHVGTDL